MDLVQGSLSNELRHLLVYQLPENAAQFKDGKHPVLKSLDGQRCVEENQADKNKLESIQRLSLE
jgi:hypothetical protein